MGPEQVLKGGSCAEGNRRGLRQSCRVFSPLPPHTLNISVNQGKKADSEWSGTERNWNFNLCLWEDLVGHWGDLLFKTPALIVDQFEVVLKNKAIYGRSSTEYWFLNSNSLQELPTILLKLLIWHEFEDILKESMRCFRPFERAWHLI